MAKNLKEKRVGILFKQHHANLIIPGSYPFESADPHGAISWDSPLMEQNEFIIHLTSLMFCADECVHVS